MAQVVAETFHRLINYTHRTSLVVIGDFSVIFNFWLIQSFDQSLYQLSRYLPDYVVEKLKNFIR
jgi:hypothetical protein